jgi:hypothetical protein
MSRHLIDRYNEFANQQPGRKFRYDAIYFTIKKTFGAKWDHVLANQFDELTLFLQRKIDGTMRGRINRSKSWPNYSSFFEYIEKYEPRKEGTINR